jgi:S1-C subfamily serine protease
VNPRLAILTGTLAGQTRAIDGARLSLGRDARSDIRFDPTADAEVSGRHAELRVEDGAVFIRDTNSTNGVYVNGTRVRGEHRLANGDVIRLGARGPKLRFDADAAPGHGATTERIAVAVDRQTRGLRAALLVAVVVAIAGGWFALWSARRADAARGEELAALRRRNDSVSAAIDRNVHTMGGRLAGLDSAVDATRMNYVAIAAANGRSVVMIAVEMPDGKVYSGSGVGVTADGAIVTNTHLVRGADGQAPRRLAIVYADTRDWLPAHIDRLSRDADLALLRVDREGPFPFVSRISDRAPVVGEPVAIIGFPLGTRTPMDGSTGGTVARSTLGVGTVSKSIPGVVQIDAFASEGSSGSPVFGEDGSIAAIVYGGAREASGRIIYAVPGSAIRKLLR